MRKINGNKSELQKERRGSDCVYRLDAAGGLLVPKDRYVVELLYASRSAALLEDDGLLIYLIDMAIERSKNRNANAEKKKA
ncbi:hypothetical protein [Rhizobium herbae]|uniref:Carotenoid cleavage dioxygenase-like enzyme n=1 Tax=Rhizobium herbae TaxID=508661 RepID=A0ABS4ELX1_9HYPH|nr:hypothetical protein [Rhizobium herbae]MBP1858946.1 carotenoid cleavage dioxygenase-like enzyme [Rhizobium herbae]